jgi:hypothetical protein
VRELDETHRLYALSFRSFDRGRAEVSRRVSGTVALWAGNRRFDVPFRDVLALDSRDRVSPETSITVRFAAPATLDGAVMTAIDEDGARRSCEPWFGPWMPLPPGTVPDRQTPEERSTEQRFLTRARAAAPIDAPAATADPRPCPTPDRQARTTYAAEVETPGVSGGGYSVVQVLLDPSDKIVSTRIERPSGSAALDFAALAAARRSEYQGVFFRCRRVMGAYLFSVEFPPS